MAVGIASVFSSDLGRDINRCIGRDIGDADSRRILAGGSTGFGFDQCSNVSWRANSGDDEVDGSRQ